MTNILSKSTLLLLGILLAPLATADTLLSAEEYGNTEILDFIGQIELISVENEFYGIVSEGSGGKYKPMNLPELYQQDGLSVHVRAIAQPRLKGIHMWGSYIKIIEIFPTSSLAEKLFIQDNCVSRRGG